MPSLLQQKGIIITNKKKGSTKSPSYILVTKKTGFMDVTINGTRYYSNNVQSYSPNTQNIYYKAVSAVTSKLKKTIVIRRIG